MDNQQPTKTPKPFESDYGQSGSATGGHQQQFELREDDRLKQEEDYRQGEPSCPFEYPCP